MLGAAANLGKAEEADVSQISLSLEPGCPLGNPPDELEDQDVIQGVALASSVPFFDGGIPAENKDAHEGRRQDKYLERKQGMVIPHLERLPQHSNHEDGAGYADGYQAHEAAQERVSFQAPEAQFLLRCRFDSGHRVLPIAD
jgi:hypothetical protein